MKLFKVKKLVHNQVLLSFLVSFAISVCIPLFLFVLKSCDRGEPISSSFVVYDESGKMSADEAWTLFQNGKAKKVEGHHLDLGFFTGVYFLFLDSKTSALKNGGVIDLGPEVIDSVSLLVPDESGKWIEYDRGGRMVKSEEKKILSWQCCVKYPVAYTNIQWGGVF